MLKSENKIFKNLYNDLGWEIEDAMKEMIERNKRYNFQRENG